MRLKFLSLVLAISSIAGAQNISYDLSGVHDSLKKKADMIMQYENIEVNIENLNKAIIKTKQVFTVISAEGRSNLRFVEYNTSYSSLGDVEIKVFDKLGKQVNKYKKKDLTVQAIGDQFIDDVYASYINISAPSYPVTIEAEYEQVLKSTLALPDFKFMAHKTSVLESNYTIRIPKDISLRHRSRHIKLDPLVQEEGNRKIFKWSIKNMAAKEYEEGSVDYSVAFPYVQVITEQFSHYGHKGDMSTWNGFGKWISQLYKGLDELDMERQQFFRELVKDAPDEEEKIRRIYDYLQKNFRYVSIQLGIGGLQPFSASFTDQKKYGDCKALSNYMKAALKTVGIKSHVAIINAEYNKEPADPAFPANTFNHVILCVPGNKDSIWLECTSNTAAFGELGNFTENRNALLITEDGGVLVPTPKSRSSANQFQTFTSIKLENDLSAITDTRMSVLGEFRGMMFSLIKNNKDDQKLGIIRVLGYKQPDDFELMKDPGKNNSYSLKMAIRKVPEFSSGSKFFISPRIHKVWGSKMPASEQRNLDFYFPFPFILSDTTVMVLPNGFTVEALPKEKTLKCGYGSYHFSTWHNVQENAVYSSTTLVLDKYKILAKDYNEVKNFFDEVLKDDSQRLVVKGTPGAPAPVEKKAF